MRSDAEVEVDVDNSKKLLAAAKLLADATARMVEAAKGAAAYPENEDQQQRLREAAEGLRVATNAAAQNAIKKKLINRLEALKTLAQAARGVAASTMDPKAAAAMLDSARDVMEGSAVLIHEAKQALMSDGDAESQQRLAQVAKAVSHSLNNCVNCLPGQKDVDMALKSIGEASKKLLIETIPLASKSFQEAQNDLTQTAADLNQSAGEVVHASRSSSNQLASASGKFSQDFDEFLDAGIEMAGHTQAVRGMLDNPSEPVSDLSYFDCIESVMENSKASYLVGVSDPNSQAGHQGLVDPIQFARANQAIQMACQNLVDPQSSPSQVHKYTCIQRIVRKALDGDFSEENRNRCRVATAPLIEAVENLTTFASNPEFASVPAKISNEVDKAPGQRECDSSIDNINKCIRDIEQASLAAISQNLPSRDDISLEALQEQLTSTVQEIGHLIDPVSTAARGEASQLGHKVCGPETLIAGALE
ncbi:hypothetical protein XENOCAPTIV_031017 [Xenoophorus captivus]|uniref:Vinculin-binding site-containing domain-containing protein n=1 Tax=Xenoophorus captivus TaxID=1517983 RepID=A0ABV0QPS3_9TELE